MIAGTGVSGTSWFDRNHFGFAAPHTIFGGKGLSPDMLGTITLIMAPVQVLLIFFSMRGFAQGWNVELEVPIEEAERRGSAVAPAAPPPLRACRRISRPGRRDSDVLEYGGWDSNPHALSDNAF